MTAPDAVQRAVADEYRAEWGQVVATLIGLTGDWDLAEDCTQEAFAAALATWPRDGVPPRPGAWLTITARNKARDRLRHDATGRERTRRLAALANPGKDEPPEHIPDERLRLIFTCCHPALPLAARVALTLRTLAGLTTGEIAAALLTTESATAQRIVRAKRKIAEAGIPYRVPPPDLLPQRLPAVLAVVYLIFNEGYDEVDGVRDLTGEAVHLGRVLDRLLPDEPEARGLLALMLLSEARRAHRVRDGVLVPLEEQDRSRWDRALIEEGLALLDAALAAGRPGPYQVQAAIAACHATAPDARRTDWRQIAVLYAELARTTPSPVVELNRAVAVAMADGPPAGLAIVDGLAATGALDGYHLLPATRADLLRRAGRTTEARAAYEEALALAPTDPERAYLARRVRELRGGHRPEKFFAADVDSGRSHP